MLKKLVIGLSTALLFLGVSRTADAVVITYDSMNRPISMTGLTIGGTSYNVGLNNYGVSFQTLFGTGDPPSPTVPAFWGNQTDANAAASAIAAALNADYDLVNEPPFATNIWVPYEFTSATNSLVRNYELTALTASNVWNITNPASFANGFGQDEDQTYATFVALPGTSQPLPSPSPIALLAVGLVGLGLAVRRRRVA